MAPLRNRHGKWQAGFQIKRRTVLNETFIIKVRWPLSGHAQLDLSNPE